MPARRGRIILWVSLALIGLGLFLGGLLFATSYSFKVQGESMLPTLHPEQRVLVNTLLTSWRKPERGDIVVFQGPTEPRDFIKRVIAVEGETVEIKADQDSEGDPLGECGGCGVYVNEVLLDESYVKATPDYNLEPTLVPPGHVFVLGDNRRNSSDSHVFGPIAISSLKGKAIYTIGPGFGPLNASR